MSVSLLYWFDLVMIIRMMLNSCNSVVLIIMLMFILKLILLIIDVQISFRSITTPIHIQINSILLVVLNYALVKQKAYPMRPPSIIYNSLILWFQIFTISENTLRRHICDFNFQVKQVLSTQNEYYKYYIPFKTIQ